MERLAERLSHPEASLQLALVALLVGLLAGLVIIAFRLLIETFQAAFLPGGDVEHYEGLDAWLRLLLPTLGGLLIGLALHWLDPTRRAVGVVHVMERLAYHQGKLPLTNFLVQFFAGAASIIAGHSVGREGPSVHLGAASGSLFGRWLNLPNNSLRTLLACGAAAAIAASFNTPLAGVIFAMEVVLMEYTLAGFAPVILAAVSATTLTRAVFGSEPAFIVPALEMGSLWELPYVVLMGLVLGGLAALFIHSLQWFSARLNDRPLWQRTTLGGALVGLCALSVPQVMGIGYDTVNSAVTGELALWLLVVITFAKLFATAAGLGLGLPGGLIGPTLVIGAVAGGAMGNLVQLYWPGELASPSFYVLIGMGAMMGATLQAPLAALTALLELTANPNIILPGMLALIAAGMVSRQGFGKESVFLILLRARGLDYRHDPVMQALRRVGVAGVMDRALHSTSPNLVRAQAQEILSATPRWILVQSQAAPPGLLPAADLARYLAESDTDDIDLAAIPAQRLEPVAVDFNASLQEALEALEQSGAEAVYIERQTAPGIRRAVGILTRAQIERSYRR